MMRPGLKVSELGAVVRTYRKASGLSQKDLAGMVGISRATLNYLESGREIEIGAGRLFEILEVLGVEISVEVDASAVADAALVDRALKAQSGKGVKKLPRAALMEALATGRMQVGWESQTSRFVDEAPDQAILAAIRLAATANGLTAKEVWKKGRNLARSVPSTRLIWRPKE